MAGILSAAPNGAATRLRRVCAYGNEYYVNPLRMGFFDTNAPLVFAHRGGCALGPENTLVAFDRGLAAGADGLELDVHLSADGVPVVHHDATLNRTTDAIGPVASRTAEALGRVDAGYRCAIDGTFPFRGQGIGIPTLADVLRRYPDTRVIIEMKDNVAAMGEAVARIVRQAGAVERACAAGFGALATGAVRRLLPELATSAHQGEVRLALYRSWVGWPPRQPLYGGYQVPEHAGRLRIVSRRFLRHARRTGLHVQVWTVDEPADMRRLLEWGVDALITNRPDVGVRERDRWRHEVHPAG